MTIAIDHRRESRTRGHLRFALHYVEMVVAMFVGMFALGPLWTWLLPGGRTTAPTRPRS